MTTREYKAILTLQHELEIRDYDSIYIKTYNFFGKTFISAEVLASINEFEIIPYDMLIDCSIDYLERYGVAHTVATFERMYNLL